MSSTRQNETEILLGNKHLLAIFFVIAILLGVAFTGGYMVGRGSPEKRTVIAAAIDPAASTQTNAPSGMETHSVAGASSGETTPADPTPAVNTEESATTKRAESGAARPAQAEPQPQKHDDQPLGSPTHKIAVKPAEDSAPLSLSEEGYVPKNGQTFLQVAAVGRNEADGVADVLSKKGFSAHSVQKPGAANVYRVLIGPIKDTGDLAATRDALRKTGFREVIVQHY